MLGTGQDRVDLWAHLLGLLTGSLLGAAVAIYPPSQKTTGVSPWMNATVGPAVALAKVGASADSAEEMKDTTGVNPWRLHYHRAPGPRVQWTLAGASLALVIGCWTLALRY